MKIDDALLERLQELARLRLPPEEREAVRAELGQLLACMGELSRLDAEGGEEACHFQGQGHGGFLREDEVTPSADREEILAGAPAQKDGYFKAPRTVE